MTDETSPDEKGPVEQALEILVFAPLGLAMTARTQLPEMVAKGRAQLEGQLTLARFVGQFAVKHGRAEVEKRLKAYAAAPSPLANEAAPVVTVPVTVLAEPAPAPSPEPSPEPSVGEDSSPTGTADPLGGPASSPTPPAADLAIPGYDALSASQVVQRLAGLSTAELEQVRAYEAATRGRKTVLTKISQLQ